MSNSPKTVNKEYLTGIIISVLIPLFMMLLYWNKSISNYDGWYNLYAQDFLNGRIPYLDFHFLMPPVYLYIWTLLQKIFGNYMIVFHAASVVCKCILSAAFFVTFKRFFNVRICLLSTILASVVMLSLVFDNCTFSYNEFVTLLCIIMLNLFISFNNGLYEKNKPDIKYIIGLAVINTVLFFTKQTHGILISLCFLILFSLILLFKTNYKVLLKSLGVYVLTSLFTAFVLFLPVMHSGIINAYINNVYMGASAKGSISDIFKLPLKLISDYEYLYLIFIMCVILFVYIVINKYSSFKVESMSENDKSVILPNNIIAFIIFSIGIVLAVCTNNILCTKFILLYKIGEIHKVINQFGALAQFFCFFASVYYFIKYIISKDLYNSNKMILFSVFTTVFISIALSYSSPYTSYFLYGLFMAAVLNIKFKYRYIVEIAAFLIVFAMLFLSVYKKMVMPFNFHGFSSLNVNCERKISKLDSLKGFNLSKQEVDIYEQMKAVTDKYLNKDDKIFTFINNTVFYNLLSRKPFYDDYYNLYWDVCPDNQAKVIYEALSNAPLSTLPKEIIYFEYPNSSIIFHEKIFRNENQNNYQRKLDMLIKDFIINKTYFVVSDYNWQKFYSENPKYASIMEKIIENGKKLNNLYGNYDYNENYSREKYDEINKIELQQRALYKMLKKKTNDLDRFIFDDGWKMKVLIRQDIYEKRENT